MVYQNMYSTNGIGTVSVDESYDILEGCMDLLVSAEANNQTIFESIASTDYAEATNKHFPNVVSESQLEVVYESGVSDLLGKVKDFIDKVGKKIKEIIEAIATRIKTLFIRDGKKLVDTYGKTVSAKCNTGKLAKMKYTWAATKEGALKYDALQSIFTSNVGGVTEVVKKLSELKDNSSDTANVGTKYGGNGQIQNLEGVKETCKPMTEAEKEDFIKIVCGGICPGSNTVAELKKNIKEGWFEDVSEEEGLNRARLDSIENLLKTNKKNLENLNKAKTAVDKLIGDAKKSVKSIEDALNKFKSDAWGPARHCASVGCGDLTSQLGMTQTISSAAFATVAQCMKDEFAQARRVYVKAVNYNGKKDAVDEATIDAFVEQANDYECDEMMFGQNFTESVLF